MRHVAVIVLLEDSLISQSTMANADAYMSLLRSAPPPLGINISTCPLSAGWTRLEAPAANCPHDLVAVHLLDLRRHVVGCCCEALWARLSSASMSLQQQPCLLLYYTHALPCWWR